MNRSLTIHLAALACAAAVAVPARAEILGSADNGFIVREVTEVSASPAEAWKALVRPADWWNGEHTFSGSAKNLTLDPAVGGCFCETLPPSQSVSGLGPGGVQHMRVIYALPGEALRMTGALGPLQSEGLAATLTITLKPIDGAKGTRITWHYVVGGFMRFKTADIAPAVDRVMAEQATGLARLLGPIAPPPAAAPAKPDAGPSPDKLPAGR